MITTPSFLGGLLFVFFFLCVPCLVFDPVFLCIRSSAPAQNTVTLDPLLSWTLTSTHQTQPSYHPLDPLSLPLLPYSPNPPLWLNKLSIDCVLSVCLFGPQKPPVVTNSVILGFCVFCINAHISLCGEMRLSSQSQDDCAADNVLIFSSLMMYYFTTCKQSALYENVNFF